MSFVLFTKPLLVYHIVGSLVFLAFIANTVRIKGAKSRMRSAGASSKDGYALAPLGVGNDEQRVGEGDEEAPF